MTVQRLQAHYGFTKMPFGRNLAPSMLHRYTGHGEAVARISWCVDQTRPGRDHRRGRCRENRRRPGRHLPPWTTSRHVIIYLPNPSVGVRGMLHHIVAHPGSGPELLHRDPRTASS